ncbi:MAG: hypothetical protein ACXW2E_11750 [Nitrososphaeraceae archaeon]
MHRGCNKSFNRTSSWSKVIIDYSIEIERQNKIENVKDTFEVSITTNRD